MSQPQEIDLAVLKHAMFDVIDDYIPSFETFTTSSDDLKESNKELAQFIISEISLPLQASLEEALNPDMDLKTFMRLHNMKMVVSDD
ncbi:TPA: hypothetical protein TZM62_000224 [Streptococcus suis]|nr:hypothetical protein [Streptococcus suis]HEM4975110.1 hypothetical protein [Streptococcus suis]HEM5288954.1 hypothetical protein [Streptococcus suis]HEM5299145.1 hypothetical protein [Streptococcus suis]HEM5302676.1 hypothetical protein [Streptococcus suis]